MFQGDLQKFGSSRSEDFRAIFNFIQRHRSQSECQFLLWRQPEILHQPFWMTHREPLLFVIRLIVCNDASDQAGLKNAFVKRQMKTAGSKIRKPLPVDAEQFKVRAGCRD